MYAHAGRQMKGAAQSSAQGQETESESSAVCLTSEVNLLLYKARIINAPLVPSRTDITCYLATRLCHRRTSCGIVPTNEKRRCDWSLVRQSFQSDKSPRSSPAALPFGANHVQNQRKCSAEPCGQSNVQLARTWA